VRYSGDIRESRSARALVDLHFQSCVSAHSSRRGKIGTGFAISVRVKARDPVGELQDSGETGCSTASSSSEAVNEQGGEVRYANTFEVGFNAFEFLFDLAQVFGSDGVRVARTRIVTSPVFARNFLSVLTSSLAQYEAQFGQIEDHYRKAGESSRSGVTRPLADIAPINGSGNREGG
jgi:uncharacterized protein DUF3467